MSDSEGTDNEIERYMRTGKFQKARDRPTRPKNSTNSMFLLTINPNISHKSLDTTEKRRRVKSTIEKFITNILFPNIENKFFLKKYKNNKICEDPINSFSYGVELGNKHGFLHTHVKIVMNCPCHLKTDTIRDLLKELFGHNIHLENKFIPNTQENIDKYIGKQSELKKLK